MYVCMYVYECSLRPRCVYECVMCVFIYVCMYECMYVCSYTRVHTHPKYCAIMITTISRKKLDLLSEIHYYAVVHKCVWVTCMNPCIEIAVKHQLLRGSSLATINGCLFSRRCVSVLRLSYLMLPETCLSCMCA